MNHRLPNLPSLLRFLLLALLPLAIPIWLPPALADEARIVHIVVPAPPGGNLDGTARMLAHKLSALTGELHVVDNRPGANTQIGIEWVARAAPDGRAVLLAGTGVVFLGMVQKFNVSPLDELAPVIQVSRESYALVVSPGGPASIEELERLAASRPGGLNCATAPGVTALACEQLKARLNGRLTVVPYPGVAPAINALLGGHADLAFIIGASASRLIQGGSLRVLAVSGRGSIPSAAHAPLLSQLWPGFLLEGLSGLFVPARTPDARIAQLNRAVEQVLADPEVGAAMREGGQELVGGSPLQFAMTLRNAQQRWAEIIQRLGLGPK